MTLKSRIEADAKTALLSGNRLESDTLGSLKAAILNEEVAQRKRQSGLEDEVIEQIIAKEVKKRYEAAALYDQNMRQDAANSERQEAEILERYLPEQLNEAELKTIVDAKIAELAAVDPKMMGQVIATVKQEVGNTADGAIIAKLVKEALAQK